MLIGNTHYVTSPYNQNKFKALLENHLSKTAQTFPSNELIEQAIAAYLDYRDTGKEDLKLILNVSYVDKRPFSGTVSVGDPAEAIIAFNHILIAYNLSKS